LSQNIKYIEYFVSEYSNLLHKHIDDIDLQEIVNYMDHTIDPVNVNKDQPFRLFVGDRFPKLLHMLKPQMKNMYVHMYMSICICMSMRGHCNQLTSKNQYCVDRFLITIGVMFSPNGKLGALG
jgi:hypothetical protein